MAVISGSGARSEGSLRELSSEVAEFDTASRLRRLLGRLSEAADAAEAEGQVPAGFGTALIDAVPELRRSALSLTCDAIAGDVQGDDLVRLTLLKAWERRAEFRSGTGMPAWLVAILRSRPVNGRVAHRLAAADPGIGRPALRAGPAEGRVAGRRVS
ncbi:RNA polymerase subunit sigma-70 [Methylobacterium sp. NMS14P]|uniref:RNA polymerase subunit sigma-70 n=1 Tax=Methylobacterium sp. NMS14P TaxID=2894310 RepID=UPI00235955E7|nr:RNA polymerase subunit sigma-70 [Methylobacterium sp. NMS14P]WCS24160.1 RNA polymerase subunit sigma-70 [Methylobacterium sp. NMS14P]